MYSVNRRKAGPEKTDSANMKQTVKISALDCGAECKNQFRLAAQNSPLRLTVVGAFFAT